MNPIAIAVLMYIGVISCPEECTPSLISTNAPQIGAILQDEALRIEFIAVIDQQEINRAHPGKQRDNIKKKN